MKIQFVVAIYGGPWRYNNGFGDRAKGPNKGDICEVIDCGIEDGSGVPYIVVKEFAPSRYAPDKFRPVDFQYGEKVASEIEKGFMPEPVYFEGLWEKLVKENGA